MAGNSGIMYHVTDARRTIWETGPEFQLEDNEKAADPIRCGWLYALYQAARSTRKTGKTLDATKPVGQWNHVRLMLTPEKCEHDINGVKYFEYVLGSEDFKGRVAKSKFARMKNFANSDTGYLPCRATTAELLSATSKSVRSRRSHKWRMRRSRIMNPAAISRENTPNWRTKAWKPFPYAMPVRTTRTNRPMFYLHPSIAVGYRPDSRPPRSRRFPARLGFTRAKTSVRPRFACLLWIGAWIKANPLVDARKGDRSCPVLPLCVLSLDRCI